MPPRIALISHLRPPSGSSLPALSASALKSITATTAASFTLPYRAASTAAQKRRRHDPYAAAQARARKAANLSRQAVLKAERKKDAGDPVRGVARTSLLESFASGKSFPPPQDADSSTTTADANNATESQIIPTPPSLTNHPRASTIISSTHATSRLRNYFLTDPEVTRSVSHSEFLTDPATAASGTIDPSRQANRVAEHAIGHANAQEALARITALQNASSKDRTRINIRRCVELFGRHNTDEFLRPKPESRAHLERQTSVGAVRKEMAAEAAREIEEMKAQAARDGAMGAKAKADQEVLRAEQASSSSVDEASPEVASAEEIKMLAEEGLELEEAAEAKKPAETTSAATTSTSAQNRTLSTSPAQTLTSLPPRPRAGPDTGSSEVQVAILTARINTLADALESPRGRNDNTNRRNLRLMVHKRQKLLKYLRRKEKGGERWERCVGLLGLGDATWKGEISL